MREHLLSGKLTVSAVCDSQKTGERLLPDWPAALGKHSIRGHVLADWPAFSSACGAGNFRIPRNRV